MHIWDLFEWGGQNTLKVASIVMHYIFIHKHSFTLRGEGLHHLSHRHGFQPHDMLSSMNWIQKWNVLPVGSSLKSFLQWWLEGVQTETLSSWLGELSITFRISSTPSPSAYKAIGDLSPFLHPNLIFHYSQILF